MFLTYMAWAGFQNMHRSAKGSDKPEQSRKGLGDGQKSESRCFRISDKAKLCNFKTTNFS